MSQLKNSVLHQSNSFVSKDYIELTKPRITFFCLIMTLCGVFFASRSVSVFVVGMTLLGTTLSVASANAFNMIYEYDVDKLMARTCRRPLASGRLSPWSATLFAFTLGFLSVLVLSCFVNTLTASLALCAIIFYSIIYTPLKVKTPLALVIGALPGAIAPVLGFTAVTNQITIAAVAIFAILFAWQMPHFIAITIYSKRDYQNAGFKVVSVVRSEKATRVQAFLWTVVLFILSLLLVPLKLAGAIYFVCALLLGLWFLYVSTQGLLMLRQSVRNNPMWPKKFFMVSLIYLPLLALSLVIDRVFALR